MAKLNRERRLLERRQEKQARKDARRASANDPGPPPDTLLPSADGAPAEGLDAMFDGASEPENVREVRT